MRTQIEFYDKDAIKNILAVLTIKPDKVVYLYDKEIRDMNFFKGLDTCFKKHIPNLLFETIPVNISSMEDIYNKTKKVISENQNCVIEMTGGSELMIIGGYKAGLEMGVELIYTDIIEGKVFDLNHADRSWKTAKLSLEDFIDAKGASLIGNSHHEPEPRDYERIKRMSLILFENLKYWKDTCTYIQTVMSNRDADDIECKSKLTLYQKDGRRIAPNKEILRQFLKNGFIHNLNFTSENVRFEFSSITSKQYMINYGVWLELLVFVSAKQSGVFDDVKLGTMIDWNAYDGISIPGNEIDIIISDNSMPVFLSCKLREADTASLNELLIAKKRVGGWFSKGILVTFGLDKVNKTGAYKRAQELGLGILDKQDILSKDFEDRLVRAIKGHDLIRMKWKNI